MDTIRINNIVEIPSSELEFHFSRSGGKGGQNVNKVETRVELLFDIVHSKYISEDTRFLLLKNLSKKVDGNGILRIVAQESRSQWKNKQLAIKKFIEVIRQGLRKVQKRISSTPTIQSKFMRIEKKKKRSETKKLRSKKKIDVYGE